MVAIGVSAEGFREILGICEGAKEDKAGWSGFLAHLKQRGLAGVELIVSDACLGLVESAAEHFPEARWQRCVVPWYRSLFSHVPHEKVREVAAMLKAIHTHRARRARSGLRRRRQPEAAEGRTRRRPRPRPAMSS